MKHLLIPLLIIALIPTAAVYLGGGGGTRTHRVAAISGALSLIGLVLAFPLAVTTALAGLASTHNASYQDVPMWLYVIVLCAGLVSSAVTSFILIKKRLA